MDHGIYGIDLKSLEYVALASGLTKEQFAVSADHSRAAWQENTGIWDSQTIQIMDLDTGDKTQVGGQSGSVTRILSLSETTAFMEPGTAETICVQRPCDGDLSEQHRYR